MYVFIWSYTHTHRHTYSQQANCQKEIGGYQVDVALKKWFAFQNTKFQNKGGKTTVLSAPTQIAQISKATLYKVKVKLATIVEGNPKAPFSIATTPMCRGGRYSFPGLLYFTLDSVPYNAECLARRHQVPFFESLVWLDLGLNPGLPGHWRTL